MFIGNNLHALNRETRAAGEGSLSPGHRAMAWTKKNCRDKKGGPSVSCEALPSKKEDDDEALRS